MRKHRGFIAFLVFLTAFCIALFVTIVLTFLNVGNTGINYLISEAIALAVALIAFPIVNKYYIDNVIKPFDKLYNGLNEVANGNFSVEIHEKKGERSNKHFAKAYDNFNKMTAELRSTELMKIDFFSDVSHEFKVPLSKISYSTALLKNEQLSDDEMQYVHAIENATRQLNTMVGNILKLNKIEHDNIALNKETFGICEQLEECLINFESEFDNKQLELVADFDHETLITSDKELLQIVWTNIISNAIKFSNVGGVVKVALSKTHDEIVVEISDNGIGMDEQTLSHIFDKFYQADKTRITDGNGLGLSLVKQISALLDLNISVSSAPQQGTKFTVIIKN